MGIVFSFNSQAQVDFWLEFNEGYDIGDITQTTRANQTIEVDIDNNSFESFLNSQLVYKIRKAFPTSNTPRLQRTYLITLNPFDGSMTAFLNRPEVANFDLVGQQSILAETAAFNITLPNDYEDIITGGRNTALDLIKAPLAWKYTTGENTLVGVADSKFDENHPDLNNKFIENIEIFPSTIEHGTGVAGIISANTNNNDGIASISYGSNLVGASCGGAPSNLINGLLVLSQYPGVRVINCSWGISDNTTSFTYLEEVYQEVTQNGVLVVAAGGNGNHCGGGICYPGAFENAILVTAVGQRYAINEFHNLIDPSDGNIFWERSWKDCFNGRPDFNEGERNYNDSINVAAPGHLVVGITDNYQDFPSGYKLNSATSIATPFVSGLASLIFSANPNLSPFEVKNIIESTTDDIYHIPYNEPYIGKLGTGRINAYRAVLTAHCTTNPGGGLDLAMQNSLDDDFSEPDVTTEHPWWSEDIWVRNQDDGDLIDDHENPEYHPTIPKYVYIRVTNDSCVTSDGTDELQVSWAKASTSLSWPTNWDGSLTMQDPTNGANILMGDEIDTVPIPSLEPGETNLIKVPWLMPNPADYTNINDQPWHFCLLARIESSNDPMSVVEDSHITSNVLNNNNIAWKNLTIVDYDPNRSTNPTGAVVRVSNPNPTTTAFDLVLQKEVQEPGKSIYDEAEVSITMDDVIYNAWNTSGKQSTNLTHSKFPNTKIVTANNAFLEDIPLSGNEHGTVYVSFNFLTDELTDKRKFIYHLIQKDATTGEVIGGETFEIRKKANHLFQAIATGPATAIRNTPISLSATTINEEAIYNWYDSEGTLIHQGENFDLVPIASQTYKLEVIATGDGFKDYDQVTVSVPPHEIISLSPNPSSNQIDVTYFIQGATTAHLSIVNTNTAATYNYVLDLNEENITLDISSLTNGYYEVALFTDNEVQDSETLLKN